MKRKCRFLLLAVAAALLCAALTACSRDGGTLPTLYLDGEEYSVTVKDGLRGLEKVHEGVITRQSGNGGDGSASFEDYVLYRRDGQVEPDYQGERKLSLESAYPVRSSDPGRESSLTELELRAVGLPVADAQFSNEVEFDALMQQNGYFPFVRAWWRICTEHGAPDPADPAFRESMREYLRGNDEYAPDNRDPAKLEELLERHSNELLGLCGYQWMIRELSEGRARLGCTVEVRFDAESGRAVTTLRLTAEDRQVLDWYEGWAPRHGESIRPEG